MYKCQNCGYISATKLGKCPSCGKFGTFVLLEDSIQTKSKKNRSKGGNILNFNKENFDKKSQYFVLSEPEIKRILTKGIKKGGVYLLGGEPGIGKSTIVLQIIDDLLKNNKNIKIGYFSGEENVEQILERMSRIVIKNGQKIYTKDNIVEEQTQISNQLSSVMFKNHLLSNFKIYHSTILEDILATIEAEKFDFVVFDSIQTIYSTSLDSVAGSVSQVKYVSEKISEFSKKYNISSFIIGHITKGGEIAGPKYLEHIVDVVLYLEGDRFGQYRFLRAKKNRFGPADEVGIFEMTLFGLKPVYDLKERIINSAKTSIPGSVLTIGIDNGRPVIVNLEVLLNKSKYKYPQRVAIGIDSNRLNLIIAILERYLNLKLSYFDIFVNIPGEWKFFDSGLDLALAAAILGQYENKIIDKNKIFIGEIGLGGQILPSKLHNKRLKEVPEGFEVIDYDKIKNIVELSRLI